MTPTQYYQIKNAPSNDSTMSVRLESINDDFFYMHDDDECMLDRMDGEKEIQHKALSRLSSEDVTDCCLSPLSTSLSLSA
jgi:hypothetical protein